MTSDNFKNVGFKATLSNGTKVEVLEYLTASAQVEKGLAAKTSGTQVLYVFSIDGKRKELRGTAFSTWCEKNGIEIIHKGGATGVNKNKRTFAVVFEELKKKASEASEKELKEAAKFLTDIAKEKAEAKKKAEADEIKSLEARLKELKAKQKSR